ncbi:SDR family NAD(P)-dependent oxidoreductase [Treponema sp.]|uniref:SDR family NAD(P)-dependent oxidoreductase n=1 Tax=Treponema sp. TaxID=166 RepID=UPI00388FC26B
MTEKIFCGKKALVAGGSGGIGREVSCLLAEAGADLVIHGSKQSEKADLLLSEIEQKTGKRPLFFEQNLFDFSFSALASSPLLEQAEKCDILCVCFGPFVQKPLHETNLSDWERAALFDYALPGLLVSAALPDMMKKKFGRILLFGGTGTEHRREFSTNAAYAGAKSGLNVLVSSVAAEYAKYNITCNAILPGFVETEYLSDSVKADLKRKMPEKRLISAASIAKTALFLMSNPDFNGALVRQDSGWSAKG